MILAIMAGCASQKSAGERPAVTLIGLTLSKEVHKQGNTAVPQGVARTFRTTDKEVAALVSFKNLYGVIKLRWDWYGPDGHLYFTKQAKPIRTDEGKYYKEFSAWHALTIAGDRVENMPGEWSVKVYMNDDLLVYQNFTVLQQGR